MHERSGDKILSKVKPNIFKFSAKPRKQDPQDCKVYQVEAIAPVSPPPLPVVKSEGIKIEDPGKQIVKTEAFSPSTFKSMTRRFSVSEKIKIIDKFRELNNISSTCR